MGFHDHTEMGGTRGIFLTTHWTLIEDVKVHDDKAEPLLLEALEGRRLKLGDTHPYTKESPNNLIDLYEARGKPEEADKWRANPLCGDGKTVTG